MNAKCEKPAIAAEQARSGNIAQFPISRTHLKIRLAICSSVAFVLIAAPQSASGQEVALPSETLLMTGTTAEAFDGAPGALVTGSINKPSPPQSDRSHGWAVHSGAGIDSGQSLVPVAAGPEPIPEVAETPSFLLPGGYGRTPETIQPEKVFIKHHRPIGFSFTLEQGYDDNPLSLGNAGANNSDKHSNSNPQMQGAIGSFVTTASIGQHLNLLTKRNFLSLDWNGGGSYFPNLPEDELQPNGIFHLISASKLTNRTLLSANLSAGYYSSPNLSLINAPTNSGQGDYIYLANLIDLSYRLTRRYSLDTTLSFGGQIFTDHLDQEGNYVETGVGEALRYIITRRFTTVLDLRASQSRYKDSSQDYDTQFILLGFDATFKDRFASSFRVGESIQEYRAAGLQNSSAPFVESALNCGFGKASSLSWINRYGFENRSVGGQPQLTYRTGLHVSLVFSPKVTTSLTCDYTHAKANDLSGQGSEQTLNATAGVEYLFSRWWRFYGRLIRSEVISGDPNAAYSRNQFLMGAIYSF